MADLKPPLRRPPGYKDPNAPAPAATFAPAPAAAFASDPTPPSKPPPTRNKPRIPASYKPRKRKRDYCCVFCCVLCFVILFLIVVVALAAALFYLLFEPKLPVFHLLSFRIASFKVSTKPDGSYLDAQVSIRVEFKNPNERLGIRYRKIVYDVRVGQGTEFGRRELAGFTQERKSTVTVKADATVKEKIVGAEDAGKLMGSYESKKMEVRVETETAVGVLVQGLEVGPVTVKLDCQTTLNSIQAANMPQCNINLFRWINIRG